jgi:GT2 family glycosyltransferase/lipopolysaccharide/colanic/teichoic acid biosynthesis glycosyltransferase
LTLSVIIVSYNVREFLEQALVSIQKAKGNLEMEVFVVDNASSDGSADLVERRFPQVKLIRNRENLGFAKANNQAIAQCCGAYICLINPDTIVQENTFLSLLSFFADHPEAGAAGCKILNPDGTLQLACRRSYPTPWVAFTKIMGLAALFPKSKLFGRYNLTYLNPDDLVDVEAISGSFMVLRREVIETVGVLDESFFLYGEDLDWCYRIRKSGWKIFYFPDTQIIHFKGESSKKSPYEHRRLFYEAMRLFVRKHFGKGKALVPSWILILSIRIRALAAFFSTLAGYLKWPLFDFSLLTCSMVMAILLRFYPDFRWQPFIIVHIVYSSIWLTSLAAHGVYSRWRFSAVKPATAIVLGLLANSALTFFFKEYGFSRAVVLYAGAINLILLPGWRLMLKGLARLEVPGLKGILRKTLLVRKALVVGDAESAERIIRRLRTRIESPYQVSGVVLSNGQVEHSEIAGVPVKGTLNGLPEIVRQERIHEVIFSTDNLPYHKMLLVIAKSQGSHVSFKLVPSNLEVIIGKATIDHLDDLPFVDLDYRLNYKFYQISKRFFDIALSGSLIFLFAPLMLWMKWIKKIPTQKVKYVGINGREIALSEFEIAGQRRPWWQGVPRLFAVWRGELSFIGRELAAAKDANNSDSSYSIKPGLTGLEQINRSLGLSQEDRERYRLYYLKNYSPLLDVEILIKTLFKT